MSASRAPKVLPVSTRAEEPSEPHDGDDCTDMVRRALRKSVEQKRDRCDHRYIGKNHKPAQKCASPKIAPTSFESVVSTMFFRTINRNRVRGRQRSGLKAIVRRALMDLGRVSQHSCVLRREPFFSRRC
jgi:hypothetical protein